MQKIALENAQFKVGDIVVIRSFPESLEEVRQGKSIFLKEPPSLIPPFMVISKVSRNEDLKKSHNESTGFDKQKEYYYQCIWFDANEGNFKTKQFYEPLIEKVAHTDTINTELQAGSKVILSSNKVERLKKYATDNAYLKAKDIANFIPPIMLVIDLGKVSLEETKNKEGINSITSEYVVKCMWYNAIKSKYEQAEFAIDVLELVEEK